ncbi:MAG: hypothetical protein IK093_11830 [Ruminiclostridium sp.]|nr:hypothetical protein [Ruminiclostridium sp.]
MNDTINTYDIHDSCCAVITYIKGDTLFLRLDSGETAVAKFSRLPLGTKVICTVTRHSTEGHNTRVSIDSVIRNRLAA